MSSNVRDKTPADIFNNHRIAYWEGLKVPRLDIVGCQVVCSKGPTGWLNGVISYDSKADEDTLANKVEQVVKYFKLQNVPFSWWIEANKESSFLAKILGKHNIVSIGESKSMTLVLNLIVKPVTPNLNVEEISTEENMREMINVLLDAYKETQKTAEFAYKLFWDAIAPAKVIHFLGTEHGKPVTAGTLFIDQKVARIFHVGTIQEARKKGYGSYLMYQMLEKAKRWGCEISALVSTPKAVEMYKKLGFQEVGIFHHYMTQV